MPPKGNPNAKRVKSKDHIADLEKQILELQRRIDDAVEINKELSTPAHIINQEDDFEKSLMEKYPSLFRKNEDDTTAYAECGIGCPRAWQNIVDSLCGSIVNYQKYRYVSILNPNKKILIFLSDKIVKPIWTKIYYFLHNSLDPYKNYRPVDKGEWWIIPQAISDAVRNTRKYKLRDWLQNLYYNRLRIKHKYIKKEIEDVKIAQVKTKFGGLRFYIDGGDDQIYGMIKFAEYLCEQKKDKKSCL
jgi:hypothetical protein